MLHTTMEGVVSYALKVFVVDAYSCHIVYMIITVDCLIPCQLIDIDLPMYVTSINMFDALVSFGSPQYEHTDACHIHRHETLSMRHSAPNAKLCQNFCRENGAPSLPYSVHSYCVVIVSIHVTK